MKLPVKIMLTIIGTSVSIVLGYFGIDITVVITIASLFGITITAHTITDIVSIIKGLQGPKNVS